MISSRMLPGVLVQITNHTLPWSLLSKREVENKQMISLRYMYFWTVMGESFITIISELFLMFDIKA